MWKASKLRIRIQDPDQHAAARSNQSAEPPSIVMGVLTPAGSISPAILTSTDRTGRNYEANVAFDTPLTLAVSARHLDVKDDKGAGIQNNARITFQHNTGASSQPGFTFVVAGRSN